MSAGSPLIPNPFERAFRGLAIAAAVGLVMVVVGVEVGGTTAIVLGSIGGTLTVLLGFGALLAHGFASRFDREQTAIDRGEALADWTLSPAEWGAFVARIQARRPRPTSRKRYRPADAPVRVVLLPTSLRWPGGYVLWDTGTMRLERARFDPAEGWIALEIVVFGPDVRVRHEWFVPVPEAERARVPELLSRLEGGA